MLQTSLDLISKWADENKLGLYVENRSYLQVATVTWC